jgi:MFS family permease
MESPVTSLKRIPGVHALFVGAILAATGYGATFVLNRHFKSYGGTEIDTGTILVVAMIGTMISVPVVGSYAKRIGAAHLAAIGTLLLSTGFTLLATTTKADGISMAGGAAIGAGWGAFYLAAPMSLSQLVTNADRTYWFTRFAAFQMAGIGLSPFLGEVMLSHLGFGTHAFFIMVAGMCCIAAGLQYGFSIVAPFPARENEIVPWLRSGMTVLSGPSRFPIVMVALGAGAFAGVMTYQSSLTEGTDLLPSTFFLTYSITVVAARWLLAGTVNRFPTSQSVPFLLGIMVSGLAVLYGLDFGLVVQITAAVLFGLGYGLVYPLIQAQAVNDTTDEELHEAVLTWFVLSYFVGIFGFPFLGGWIIVVHGQTALVTAVVLFGAAELILSLIRNRSMQIQKPAGV